MLDRRVISGFPVIQHKTQSRETPQVSNLSALRLAACEVGVDADSETDSLPKQLFSWRLRSNRAAHQGAKAITS